MNTNNPKDKWAVAFSMVGVGLALYWMFTYSGPYRFLAELQLKWFGWYVPKLTVLVIVMGFIAIAATVRVLFRGAEVAAPTLPQGSGIMGAGVSVSVAPQSASGGAWLSSPYARMWFLLIPLGLGGYFYVNAAQAGQLQQLRVQDFDNGQLKSRVLYAEVRGQLSRKYMMKNSYMYIPMLEASGTEPTHVLVGVDKAQTKKYLQVQPDSTFVVRGMVDKGPEADVRVAFEKNGIALADPCWVVHTGRDPKSDRQMGLILMAVSAVLAAAMGSWLSYKRKQSGAAQALQVGV